MSLCPEHDYRSSLTDNAFWAHVYPDVVMPDPALYDEPDFDEISETVKELESRCTICGSYGACAYDSEGRPTIHLEDDKS